LISRNRKRVKTIVELLIDTPSESLKEDLLETEQKLKAQTTQKAEFGKGVKHSQSPPQQSGLVVLQAELETMG
jgi:hypothetical protein